MSLFDDRARPNPASSAPAPLAERMRPRTLDEFVGQDALLGPGRPLRLRHRARSLQSIILWGPPGTGKTTLARFIANVTRAHFISFSAVLSGIKEIREVMAEAEEARRRLGRRTILFIDEIHRFNKAQQDAFLPRVEAGDIVLIGATTENPSFEVNAALLSRSKVFVLQGARTGADRRDPAARARTIASAASVRWRSRPTTRRCAGSRGMPTATRGRAEHARDGVAARRREPASAIDVALRRRPRAEPRAALRQDRRGALQPDLGAAQVDAQQRSRRGGLLAGADDRGRRGSAVHRAAAGALRVRGHRQRRPAGAVARVAAKDAVHFIGMPEGNTALAQAAIYLAVARRRATPSTAPIRPPPTRRRKEVAEPVPLHLRNAPTR